MSEQSVRLLLHLLRSFLGLVDRGVRMARQPFTSKRFLPLTTNAEIAHNQRPLSGTCPKGLCRIFGAFKSRRPFRAWACRTKLSIFVPIANTPLQPCWKSTKGGRRTSTPCHRPLFRASLATFNSFIMEGINFNCAFKLCSARRNFWIVFTSSTSSLGLWHNRRKINNNESSTHVERRSEKLSAMHCLNSSRSVNSADSPCWTFVHWNETN